MSFIPRATFPSLDSLPRSYFLGHHAAGLSRMRTMLSQIDLIIECRDYRIPLTSRNPMFEDSLEGKERLIVYTKKDLGGQGSAAEQQKVGQYTFSRPPSGCMVGLYVVSRDIHFFNLSTILLPSFSPTTSLPKTSALSLDTSANRACGKIA